jgi:hypothetical protein
MRMLGSLLPRGAGSTRGSKKCMHAVILQSGAYGEMKQEFQELTNGWTGHCRRPAIMLISPSLAENNRSMSSIHPMFAYMR